MAANPYSVVLVIDSIKAGEAYNVWGGEHGCTPGTLLASHQTSHTFTLPDIGTFDYISITASDTSVFSNVTLEGVGVTTPEPSSVGLLLLGLVTLLGVGTLGKKLPVA